MHGNGEAELNSQVKCIAGGLRMRTFGTCIGASLSLRSHSDWSTARGILNRAGVVKTKHWQVEHSLVRELVRQKEVEVIRVARSCDTSDALMHPRGATDLHQQLARVGLVPGPNMRHCCSE